MLQFCSNILAKKNDRKIKFVFYFPMKTKKLFYTFLLESLIFYLILAVISKPAKRNNTSKEKQRLIL